MTDSSLSVGFASPDGSIGYWICAASIASWSGDYKDCHSVVLANTANCVFSLFVNDAVMAIWYGGLWE